MLIVLICTGTRSLIWSGLKMVQLPRRAKKKLKQRRTKRSRKKRQRKLMPNQKLSLLMKLSCVTRVWVNSKRPSVFSQTTSSLTMLRQITLQLTKEMLSSQKQLLVWAKWPKWWVVHSLTASSRWFHAPARTRKVQSSLRESVMFGARSDTGNLKCWPQVLYRALNGPMVLLVESTPQLRSPTRMEPNGTGV